jgi:hypothetical protein
MRPAALPENLADIGSEAIAKLNLWASTNAVLYWQFRSRDNRRALLLFVPPVTSVVVDRMFTVFENRPRREAEFIVAAASAFPQRTGLVGMHFAATAASVTIISPADVARRHSIRHDSNGIQEACTVSDEQHHRIRYVLHYLPTVLSSHMMTLTSNLGTQMAAKRKDWQARVKGLLKAELKRRNLSYAELADKLDEIGVKDSERNISNKISRGTFTAVFFLQCMDAIGCQTIHLESK